MPEPTRILHRHGAELRVYADTDALRDAAAATLVDVRGRDHPWHLALTGGSTPEALYRRIAARTPQGWGDTHVWMGDERSVGPEHPDSNWGMANTAMLRHLDVAPEHLHRMRGELPADEAARAYAAELRTVFGGAALPRFDLLLLGVGEDGHTASLFPGTAALAERQRWVTENWVPELDTWRITLTMAVLCAAARTWIFAAGPRKAAIVRDVLGPERDPERWPVQGVGGHGVAPVWWLDEAAAARLG